MINKCYTLQKQPHRTITNKTHGKQISLLSFIVKRVKTRKTKTLQLRLIHTNHKMLDREI